MLSRALDQMVFRSSKRSAVFVHIAEGHHRFLSALFGAFVPTSLPWEHDESVEYATS
jgi:hypothetical protein